ncbi:MAG: MFS transporter [bacterium]|nr:MFS transporter [bacterium]
MKFNSKRTLLIGLAFMSISAFWQMYDTIIPLILKDTFYMKETITGVIMAADNVLALFLLPFFGALSDKIDTRIGKRMPFILVGTTLSVIFLMILPVADKSQNLVLFVVTLFMLLISLGLYRSPAVALMPDLTPKPLRSKGNAIINLMGAVGGVYALIMIKTLVGNGLRPDYTPLFLSIAGLMVICVLILFSTIKEKKLRLVIEEDDATIADGPKSTADLPKDVKKSLLFLLASISLWFIAYNAVTTAFSRYATHVWEIQNGAYANSLIVSTVCAIISYIPIGLISSKIGRKKTILIGVSMLILCYLCAGFYGTYHFTMNIFFGLIGFAWAAINVNSLPMVVEISTASDVGRYTGYYYTFSMAAQVVTPILSGFLLEHVSYHTLFPYAVLFSGLAFITMLFVKHGDSKPEKKETVLDHFDVED